MAIGFFVLLILVIIVGLMIFTSQNAPVSQSSGTRALTRQAAATPGSKRYRIWTPGTENGVEGRYYMAAYGVTQDTANKIIQQAAATAPQDPITPQQMQIAAATIAIGTIVFYFRAKGDERPFVGATYLKPIGDLADITSDDVFALTQLSTQTLIQVPAIDNDQVSACNKPELCRDGILGFGGVVTGSPLQFQTASNNGVYILRQTPTGTQGLAAGPFLCPYQPENGTAPSDTLVKACSVIGTGGPRIPRMIAGQGDVYYLEPVA